LRKCRAGVKNVPILQQPEQYTNKMDIELQYGCKDPVSPIASGDFFNLVEYGLWEVNRRFPGYFCLLNC